MRFYASANNESAFQLMIYHPIQDIWFYLLAAAVLEGMAIYSWRYRKVPAAMLVSISFALRAVWLVALVMVTISDSITDKLFWLGLQQLCAIGIIPLFLLIVLYFTRKKLQTIQRTQKALLALTAFFWLVLLTTRWSGWLWQGVLWDGTTFGILRGPAHWMMTVTGYCIIVAGLIQCFRWSLRVTGLRRWQAWALLLGPLVSMGGHYFWSIGQKIGSLPLLPLSFMISGIIWGGIFLGLRVFSLMELAETTVTRNMNDSLIVIDAQDYVVELNPAAQRLFSEQAAAVIDSPVLTAFAPWPALIGLAATHETAVEEIQFLDSHYRTLVRPLTGWNNRKFGKVIVLQDISEQKKAQALILDQHKAISIMTERDRLGRELHDGAGQLWGYINLQVEAACLLLAKNNPAEADRQLQRLAEVIRDVHVDIRESIAGLRTEVATDRGLWQSLEEYIEWFSRNHDIDARLVIDKKFTAGMLSAATSAQLLRIIQEALTNIRKHAGAHHATVLVRQQQDTIEIRIKDDGRGFDLSLAEKKGCYGLRIMKERAEEAGAQLKIESVPFAGTTVIVSLPEKCG